MRSSSDLYQYPYQYKEIAGVTWCSAPLRYCSLTANDTRRLWWRTSPTLSTLSIVLENDDVFWVCDDDNDKKWGPFETLDGAMSVMNLLVRAI